MLALLFSRAGLMAMGALAVAGALTFTHYQAYQRGAATERAATLSRSVEALRERNRVDENISTMDARSICLELGGLPDECDSFAL